MKKTKITRVTVDRLRLNEGQLPWLPKNPRSWTQTDIDRMVKSVEEDPDFADVRPVLAVPGPDPKEGSSAPAAKEGKAADLVDLKIPLAPEEFAFVKRTLGETADSDRDALLLLLGYDPDGEAGEL